MFPSLHLYTLSTAEMGLGPKRKKPRGYFTVSFTTGGGVNDVGGESSESPAKGSGEKGSKSPSLKPQSPSKPPFRTTHAPIERLEH